jgi:hypothetical protein
MNTLTPRAIRWVDTLLEMAKAHHNAQLKRIALKITKEQIEVRIDLSPEQETILLHISADALKRMP